MRQERAGAPRRSERPSSKDWCDQEHATTAIAEDLSSVSFEERKLRDPRSGSAVFERKLFRSGSFEERKRGAGNASRSGCSSAESRSETRLAATQRMRVHYECIASSSSAAAAPNIKFPRGFHASNFGWWKFGSPWA